MFTPIRDGNRGGRGLFSWEEVRVMSYRDRECYLGSTSSLGFLDKGGRWRKKDWWVKNSSQSGDSAEQMERVRDSDLNNIKQALGILEKPKTKKRLNESETKELLRKRTDQVDGETEVEPRAGLGFLQKPVTKTPGPELKERDDRHKEHKRHKKHREKHY